MSCFYKKLRLKKPRHSILQRVKASIAALPSAKTDGAGDQIASSKLHLDYAPLQNPPSLKLRWTGVIPPFCCGSNGFFASSNLTRPDKIKTRKNAGLNFMGRVTRFELATFGTTNRRSNQLSYTRHNFLVELIRLELTTPCMPCKCSTN